MAVLTSAGITFGDATTQTTAATAPTTAQVLSATAGASVGAVGTYAFLIQTNMTTYAAGTTLAGSSLRYASANSVYDGSIPIRAVGTPAGTWRLMGYTVTMSSGCQTFMYPSVWLRIS